MAKKRKKKLPDPKMEPRDDRVIIIRDEAEAETAGGILLPDVAKEQPRQGFVVKIGDDEEIKAKVGQKVIYAAYAGTEVEVDEVTFLIIQDCEILAVIDEDD